MDQIWHMIYVNNTKRIRASDIWRQIGVRHPPPNPGCNSLNKMKIMNFLKSSPSSEGESISRMWNQNSEDYYILRDDMTGVLRRQRTKMSFITDGVNDLSLCISLGQTSFWDHFVRWIPGDQCLKKESQIPWAGHRVRRVNSSLCGETLIEPTDSTFVSPPNSGWSSIGRAFSNISITHPSLHSFGSELDVIPMSPHTLSYLDQKSAIEG